ncbi:MAG: DedA family protein [Chlorobiaceae bacterium]
MIESIIAYLQSADPDAIYLTLFLIAFLKNFLPLLPLDLPIALTGYLLIFSKITIASAVLWPSIGSTSGFMVIYLVSRRFGLQLYARDNTSLPPQWGERIHRFFPPAEMEHVRQRFAAHGYLAILVNRFLLGTRSLIAPVSGLMHLNSILVLPAAAASALAWNMLLLYGGYFLGRNWKSVGEFAAVFSIPVTALFLVLMVKKIRHFVNERKQHAGELRIEQQKQDPFIE